MSEQLFREIADPTVRVRRATGRTVVVSIIVHTVLLLALVVVPLMATGAIPTPRSVMLYVAPPMVPPPPLPSAPPPPTPQQPQPTDFPDPAAAPTVEPAQISDPPAAMPPAGTPSMGNAVVVPWTGVPGGLAPVATPPVPPPPPPPPQAQRVGGAIKEPTKVRHVDPVYPPIAVAAKVEGTVIIEATIDRDGTIADAKVLRSVALLDQAALEAVRQWRFTPTHLNGVPIPVIMTVTVRFTLR